MVQLGFARQMEREAETAARRFRSYIHGIKPWYSHAALFDGPTSRVFVGAQPGGGPESQELDRRCRHLERVYTDTGYNSWLDDEWEGTSSQSRALRVFGAMYGDDEGAQVLRNTPCFNVAPFRVPKTDDLPESAWEFALGWFQRVLEDLSPGLIICNGNGGGRSPWTVIEEVYSIRSSALIPVQGRAASLKMGTVMSGPVAEAKVVGLPNISRFGPHALFRELERRRPFQ